MITDLQVQHELLKTALEATDNYLAIEKRAKEQGVATSSMIHDFTYEMSRAHDALQALGVLDKHEEYMKFHVDEVAKLANVQDSRLNQLPYTHVPKSDVGEVEESVQEAVWDQAKERQNLPKEKLSPASKAKAKARAKAAGRPYPNMVDNIWAARQQESTILSFSSFIREAKEEEITLSEEEIQEIVDSLKWEDIADLYDDSEFVREELETEPEVLDERLSAQARLKKRQAFARSRGKRNVARGIKLRRASSMEVLKKRAKIAARRAIYNRLLRGRDKSTLSAAEKDRVEQQVARMKYLQQVVAQKMVPKMREIEQKRLTNLRAAKSSAPKGKALKAPPVKKKAAKK